MYMPETKHNLFLISFIEILQQDCVEYDFFERFIDTERILDIIVNGFIETSNTK